ncbi:hypothetical protein [uncultured Fretibacterium sp.]|uniref:ComF family protein n=1 Tax=uncultured Fretibacterium sp. TaxID=1678694 RepID=UPI0026068CC2|nr:hypothetical protein [uncultured Fretibacterium sp.]
MIDGTPSPLRWVRDCLDLLLHTLWPVACPVCGRLGQVLCGECLSSLLTRQIPRCLSCGGPAPCIDHPRSAPILPGAIYEGKVREIIHRLKYGQTRALGPILGRGLAGLRPRPSLEVLIPVPLHLKSPRGYNQAEAIALGLGRAWGIPVRSLARWSSDVPARTRLSRAERRELRTEDFVVASDVRGLRVGLVDDVCTTGTTLSRLASACTAAGARVEAAFVLAHVPG